MARIFPRAARRRVMAGVAAGSMLVGFAAVPLASASDLHDRKERVQGRIDRTLENLEDSSAELIAATRALHAAQRRLAAAQERLAETRGQLVAAEALDRRMQAELDAAVRRLEEARAELVRGRAEVGRQEELLGRIAVQNYQTGDPALLGLTMVLTSQDPVELSSQLNAVRTVMDKEAVTLDRLAASEVLLTVQEEEVEAAKQEVAVRRRAAAENLERKVALEAQAEEAEAQVADLVTERAAAQRAAARAREADLAVLRGLQQERDRISELLRKRAEAARRRAAARAAEKAAAAQRGSDGPDAGSATGSAGFLDYPVDGYVTSPYGMRLHPIYRRWALHDGTDLGAPCGTPVRAPASGTVLEVYYNEAYGNRVIIDHGYERGVGLGTAYNHLSGFATSAGDRVQRGEVIGYVGNTGYSTGCHLHFTVYENGATVDPMQWLE